MTVKRLQRWYASQCDEGPNGGGLHLYGAEHGWTVQFHAPPAVAEKILGLRKRVRPGVNDEPWHRRATPSGGFQKEGGPSQMVGLVNEFLDVYEQATGVRMPLKVQPDEQGQAQGGDLLERVQEWYVAYCTGEGPWQHEVCIANVVEPDGWFMRVDAPSAMRARLHEAMRPIEGEVDHAGPWLKTYTFENAFIGACSPLRLEELMEEFFATWERAVSEVSTM